MKSGNVLRVGVNFAYSGDKDSTPTLKKMFPTNIFFEGGRRKRKQDKLQYISLRRANALTSHARAKQVC